MQHDIKNRPCQDGGLVSTSISEKNTLDLYPVSLKVRRPGNCPDRVPPDRSGTTITGFSDKSRRNLRFAAVNAFPSLISQFGLTYHNEWPTDGRTCKAHLHNWLMQLRAEVPGVSYLWILEFQKRNAPHYHVFLSVPPDEKTRLRLAAIWCRITAPSDPDALIFHRHEKNWIAWEMNSASYLCKYLEKEAQKSIPEGYSNFGRFWGNSRGLVPAPISMPIDSLATFDEVNETTGECVEGEKVVIRWLGKLAEKQTRGFSRFRSRAGSGSYTILRGTAAYLQIERYLSRRKETDFSKSIKSILGGGEKDE